MKTGTPTTPVREKQSSSTKRQLANQVENLKKPPIAPPSPDSDSSASPSTTSGEAASPPPVTTIASAEVKKIGELIQVTEVTINCYLFWNGKSPPSTRTVSYVTKVTKERKDKIIWSIDLVRCDGKSVTLVIWEEQDGKVGIFFTKLFA